MVLPVFLVGVLLPAHPGAHAPHQLLLELGVDQLAGEGVAVARARPHLGLAALAAGELGGVLGAAQLVLARVLHVVGPEVRLGRPSKAESDCLVQFCDRHVGFVYKETGTGSICQQGYQVIVYDAKSRILFFKFLKYDFIDSEVF